MLARFQSIYAWWVWRVRRITTSGRLIPEIDGLRFLAIGAVFAHHVFTFVSGTSKVSLEAGLEVDALGKIVNLGSYGVQLFFIISGFILGVPFAECYLRGAPPVSLRNYFIRRLTRLEPPYLLAITLYFVLSVWFWHESVTTPWPHLLASFVYLHNIIYGTHSTIMGLAWSLEIEVQFYVVAPLLAVLFRIAGRWQRRLVMVGLIVMIMVLQTSFITDGSRVYFTLLGFVHFFLAGMILADVYVTDWNSAPACSPRYDAAMLVFIVVASLMGAVAVPHAPVYRRYLLHFAALAILVFPVVAAFRTVYFRRWMTCSLLVAVGGMCYTIYLMHSLVMHIIGEFTRTFVVTQSLSVNLLVHGAIFTLPVMGWSTLFFLTIEKPCMRKDWPVRLYRKVASLFSLPERRADQQQSCRVEEQIP